MTPVQHILANITAQERRSAIEYDLNRVATWQRRQGQSYARRGPSLVARVLAWMGGR